MFTRLKIAALSAAVALMAGFGLGVGFEHRPPIGGWIGKRLGESLAAQRDNWRTAATRHEDAAEDWRAALVACETTRRFEAAAGKESVEQRSAAADDRAGRAFDNGYLAGRTAGRLSCKGGADGPSTDPGAAGAGAGGVRDAEDDLAGRFNAGAYRPR